MSTALFRRDHAQVSPSGRFMGKASGMMSKVGGAMAGMAATAGLAFGADQVLEFGKAALTSASDVAESTSKIKTVFGGASKGVISFGKNANKSMGLADKDSLEYLGTLGAMFTGLGKTQGESAGLSEKTMKLAADLGSFNNVSTPETLDMMSAAFRGEYDSIQKMLPGLNAAAVEQEALAETHKTSAKDLTQTEKAMATLSLMYKQAGPAVGDFARTSQGAANQQKIMASEMEDMKTTVGQWLLPIFNAVLKFVNNMLFPGLKALAAWLGDVFVPSMVDAWNFIWKYIGPPIKMISGMVMGIYQVLENLIGFIINVFTGDWKGAWGSIVAIFKGVWLYIKSYVDLIWHYIQMVWNIIWGVLKAVGSLIFNAAIWPFRTAWAQISLIMSGVWKGVTWVWDHLAGFFTGAGRGIRDAITWPFRTAWDFIKSTWNNTLGKIHFTVPKWIPGIGGNKFEMPKLAKGGIVSRPTLALIGEAGPEAVIPLHRAGSMGSNVFNINVTAGVGDPVAIGRQVVDALRAYERVNGPRPSGARGGQVA